MAGSKPGERRGGRQKGTPNKAPKKPRKPRVRKTATPAELARELADKYTASSRPSEESGDAGAMSPSSPADIAPANLTPLPYDARPEPLATIQRLLGWTMAEFDRLSAMPGREEKVLSPEGKVIKTRTAEEYVRLAAQVAEKALPYTAARISPVDPHAAARGSGAAFVVKVVRQGATGDSEEITVGVRAA